MTNNLVLSLLALVLSILAALFPLKREDQPPPDWRSRVREIRGGSLLVALVLLAFVVATLIWPSVFPNGAEIALALTIGAVVATFSAATGESMGGFAAGMAVVGAGLIHLLPQASVGDEQVAYVAGAFLAAFATGGLRSKLSGGYLCVLAAMTIVSADFLGRMAVPGSEPAASAGVALGVAGLVAAVLSGLVAKGSASGLIRGGVGFILAAAIGYVACWKYLGNAELANLWLGGTVIGVVVHLMMAGEDQPEAFRFVLATVIWLGAATVAFGMSQTQGMGYGMAIALLGGITTLILLGNQRALMTISVAVAILIYRLFREMYPEDAKALDIGQHYTMIGLAIGALLPLLPLEWMRGRELTGWRALAGTKVWLLILIGSPIAAAVLLGSKGAIGMVVGLSFAAVVEGLRGAVNLAPAGIAAGLGALSVLSYGWLGDWADLERAAKVKAVLAVGIVALVLAASLFGISRDKGTTPEQQ